MEPRTDSMSTASTVVAEAPRARQTRGRRVASIDVFRGLTMMVMIFVNELAEVRGLPWWTYHAHAQQDVMTYVDMVFPFFLFIVGMSMPFAIERRLELNPSQLVLWRHIGLRALGLLVLGLILANGDKGDPTRMGISQATWTLLGLAAAILFWLVPSHDARFRNVYRVLRIVGLLMLVAVFAIFRRTTTEGRIAWIDGSYPEILGLIGYTYLSVALLYVPTRRWRWAPLVWFTALTALCALQTAHLLPNVAALPLYLWPFNSGAWASITVAGIVTSGILLGKGNVTLRRRMWLAFAFAVTTLAAAWLLTPLGISKIRATPTWCLASVSASVLAFMLLYWICDVRAKTAWARFVDSAGENTLLTYLLPDIYYYLTALLGFTYLDHQYNQGRAGVVRAVVFTSVVLLISAGLTKARIRLQL
jgi:heparan-alpha-glucosaminide N-acetyltransferase